MIINKINKRVQFDEAYQIKLIDNCTFEIPEGKIISIVAPFGSGKSTLLKIISGLENDDSGFNNKLNNSILIPAEASSFPWLSVKQNILFADKNLNHDELTKLIHQVGLTGYENHFANNKSLGFRFRISLARALAAKLSIILLDEPFTKMNSVSKKEVLQLIVDINKQTNTTFLLATTNLTESILISDRIYLMKKLPAQIVFTTNIKHESDLVEDRLHSPNFIENRTILESQLKSIESQQLFSISI